MAKISEVMANLPNMFVKDKAKGWDRCIKFALAGEEPCVFTAVIKGQEIAIHDGEPTAEEAAMKFLEINGNSEHVCQMFSGEVPPMQLVNGKKIQMKGSIIDSMSFSRIWNIPKK